VTFALLKTKTNYKRNKKKRLLVPFKLRVAVPAAVSAVRERVFELDKFFFVSILIELFESVELFELSVEGEEVFRSVATDRSAFTHVTQTIRCSFSPREANKARLQQSPQHKF
jgi:hypothetical protein